ncbi:MAG: aminotransferase class III-fold pyridoxal phosphate-dependent enzyme [Chlorobia bacterium]|nr:aminotransferase class III-fold pyridoxal phosphate-dependent enzyme [Fimbriimonadaceae bacterium]
MPTVMPTQTQFPGPISAQMLDELSAYVIATPYPFVLDLEKCDGMWLETVDGQRLFDWAGYYGSKLIGHNHPGLYEPSYFKRLVLAANNKVANPDFLTKECLAYYRMLHRLGPEIMRAKGSMEVYAVNSGAEAVENMMKYLVAKFNQKKIAQGKLASHRKFLYFDKAFHGRTVFALGVTQTTDPVATRDFHGLTSTGNIKLPFPSYASEDTYAENLRNALRALEQVESVLSQMSDEIVGIIVEPIQGAGGHRVAVKEFFQGLSELAEKYYVYLAFDEVQTGLGATGKMWAIDHFDLPHAPMVIAAGKKFGCGVVYMQEPLEDVGVLDSTWGGTLADMVRVVREVELVEEEGLIQKAADNGEALSMGLHALVEKYRPMTTNVRGLGLYQGFSLDTPERKADLIRVARDEFGLLLLGAGSRTIRTRPNLSVTGAEIAEFIGLLDGALRMIKG